MLKGPASVLYGQNEPGGIVNMVSKRPTATPIREVVLGGGSQDRRYGAFDVGGALDEQGTYLYRLTGVGRDINSRSTMPSRNASCWRRALPGTPTSRPA